MSKRRTPEHRGGFKFEHGQAVLILVWPSSFKGYLTTIPGVIVGAGAYFFMIQTAQGLKRVRPTRLHPRGYCPRCEAVAHLDRWGLVCPRCDGDATTPVPEALLPIWDRIDDFGVTLARAMLRHGCTLKESYAIVYHAQRSTSL